MDGGDCLGNCPYLSLDADRHQGSEERDSSTLRNLCMALGRWLLALGSWLLALSSWLLVLGPWGMLLALACCLESAGFLSPVVASFAGRIEKPRVAHWERADGVQKRRKSSKVQLQL